MNNQIGIEGVLPVFAGFYGSHLADMSDDIWEEDISTGVYPAGAEPNYKAYFLETAKLITDWVEKELSEYVEKIEFERLYSPKEYNFENDKIYVKFHGLKKDDIREYCKIDKDDFKTFLEDNFKSRSGFTSFYSYDVETWLSAEYEDKGIYWWTLLSFICQQEGIEESGLYDLEFPMLEPIG